MPFINRQFPYSIIHGLFLFGFLYTLPLSASCLQEEPVIKNIIRVHAEVLDSTQLQALSITKALRKGNAAPYQEVFQQHGFPVLGKMLVISAASQTQGMGSNGRVWHSPLGGMYMTAIVPIPEKLESLCYHVPQVSNLAVCQTLEHFGLKPQFKWLNEAIIDDRKCAGVLCALEGGIHLAGSGDETMKASAVVIGIGINVTMTSSLALEKYKATTDTFKIPFTSILMETGKNMDPIEVLSRLERHLATNLNQLFQGQDFGRDFLPLINARLAYVGKTIEYSDDYNPVRLLTFQGLNWRGEMIATQGDTQLDPILDPINVGRIRPYSQ